MINVAFGQAIEILDAHLALIELPSDDEERNDVVHMYKGTADSLRIHKGFCLDNIHNLQAVEAKLLRKLSFLASTAGLSKDPYVLKLHTAETQAYQSIAESFGITVPKQPQSTPGYQL
ncbi:MAG: hypothetical protein AB7L92_00950 [Alphaproteobacteria bacterium]